MTPATLGTSKPRLGTTWDDFRRPRRPIAHSTCCRMSRPHHVKHSTESGTFLLRSGTFRNVPNVPGCFESDGGVASRPIKSQRLGRFNGVLGRFTGFWKRPKRPDQRQPLLPQQRKPNEQDVPTASRTIPTVLNVPTTSASITLASVWQRNPRPSSTWLVIRIAVTSIAERQPPESWEAWS
jgi:hypothetical protein